MRPLLLAVLALGLAYAANVQAQETLEGPATALDGDTILIAGRHVRLFGIDAPEMRGDWPLGAYARAALDDLLDGALVNCTVVEIDRRKRLVARCTATGIDLSAAMVARGWAVVYRRFTTDYDAEERAAHTAGVGIWATPAMRAAPLRPTWREWFEPRVVVTGLGALLGLFLAAWAKYIFDLRIDANRRAQEAVARGRSSAIFAAAIRAEMTGLMGDAFIRIGTFDDIKEEGVPVSPPAIAFFDIPVKPIYASNTGRIGELELAAKSVVTAHSRADHIRTIVVGVRAHPSEMTIEVEELAILGPEFHCLLVEAAEAVNDICAFLGEDAVFPDPKKQILAQMKAEAAAMTGAPSSPS